MSGVVARGSSKEVNLRRRDFFLLLLLLALITQCWLFPSSCLPVGRAVVGACLSSTSSTYSTYSLLVLDFRN